jgi:hypothetical protein
VLPGAGERIFATLLEVNQQARDAAKGTCHTEAIVEAGFGNIVLEFHAEETQAEVSGGDLETDFGDIGGVLGAEKVEQGVLTQTLVEQAFLVLEPILVTASIPIGDIPSRDAKTEFGESGNNLVIMIAILKHTIDEIAFEFGKGGDFAVSPAACDLGFGIQEVAGFEFGAQLARRGCGTHGGFR